MPIFLTKSDFRSYFSGVSNDSTIQEMNEVVYHGDPVNIINKRSPLTIFLCEFQSMTIHEFSSNFLALKKCRIEELRITQIRGLGKLLIEDCEINSLEISSSQNQHLKIEIIGEDCKIGKAIIKNADYKFNWKIDSALLGQGRFDNVEILNVTMDFLCVSHAVINISIHHLVSNRLEIDFCRDSKIDLIGGAITALDVQGSHELEVYFSGFRWDLARLLTSSFKSLKIANTHEGELTIAHCEADKVEIVDTKNLSLKINESERMDELSIRYCRAMKGFRMMDCELNSFLLQWCNFNNEVEISNSSVGKTFQILNTNLGTAILNNIHLEKVCAVQIVDSKVIDVAFSGFAWNKNYQLVEDNFGDTQYKTLDKYMVAVRESYRQLKGAYIKGNNKIEALEFQKHELNIHYKILNKSKYKSWRDFGNFLIVGSNKLFSDFGQNIWKPLVYLFLVHAVLFNAMLFFNSSVGLLPSFQFPMDWSATSKGVSLYFQTIIPTHHHLVKNYGNEDISIAGFWDFMARISASYFIFYFISASRKYHQS